MQLLSVLQRQRQKLMSLLADFCGTPVLLKKISFGWGANSDRNFVGACHEK